MRLENATGHDPWRPIGRTCKCRKSSRSPNTGARTLILDTFGSAPLEGTVPLVAKALICNPHSMWHD